MVSNTPTPGVTPPDINKTIDQYVKLRDKKRLLERQHKDQLKPFNDLLEEIEGMLLSYMQRAGVNSIATDGGTAYQSTTPRATIGDGDAFRQFVIANQLFDLVDWRANATRVFDYINEHNGQVPPGVNPSTYTKVNFRRPGE
jgi:hypothetical protein